jgi:hypothetical protein
MKNAIKLLALIAIAFISTTCTPKNNGASNEATSPNATQAQTQTEDFSVYGLWLYVGIDANGNFYVPEDEGPGEPTLMINDDNSIAYSAYETDIKGRINMIDANNYQFMVNSRSRMVTQETVNEIIYLQYNPDTKLLKYNDRRWEEEYYFVKMGTQPQNPTGRGATIAQTQTPLADFQIDGTTLVKYIGDELHVDIPDGITNIGNYAFFNNRLRSVTIPNSVTHIGDLTFQSCRLTSVTIPDSVIEIGGWAFAFNQLTSVVIGNNVTSIGNFAFEKNQLTSLTIPKNVTYIGVNAFSGNKLNGNVTIPDASAVEIGWRAFEDEYKDLDD